MSVISEIEEQRVRSDQTIADVFKSLGNDGDRVVRYAIVGSITNVIIDVLEELNDEDLIREIQKIQEMIGTKMEEIMDMPVGVSE